MSRALAWEDRYEVNQEGCWLWLGSTSEDGYGRFTDLERKTQSAHRSSWLRSGRIIPEGLELDHLCRVRHCVNPDHLEAVTHRENVRRSVSAKLTFDQVVEIRQTAASPSELATRYGVSTSLVKQIRRGVVWPDAVAVAPVVPTGRPSSQPAADHIRTLLEAGLSCPRVAAMAGVNAETIRRVLDGRTPSMRHETSRAILAIKAGG